MKKVLLFVAALSLIASAEAGRISFKAADANVDGKVDQAEFTAAFKLEHPDDFVVKNATKMFKKKDANKDGFLTESEMKAKKK